MKSLRLSPVWKRSLCFIQGAIFLLPIVRGIHSNPFRSYRSTPMDQIDPLRAIKGVIFDMDGTLTEPDSIDFSAMYTRNGLQRRHGTDILQMINSLPTESEREAAMNIILEEELRGIERMVLRPHLHTLVHGLSSARIRTALSTRNCELAYMKFLERAELEPSVFMPALHRDSLSGINKPDPAVARHILDHWEVEAGEEHLVWFVGDSLDDMLCGRAAGCSTCLVATKSNTHLLNNRPGLVDIVVNDLLELKEHFFQYKL